MNIFVFCGNLNKVGGVTESVSNFIRAATSSGHSVRSGALAIFKNLYKYDFSYINYSRPYKRLIAALLSRLYAKKTVVVYHGLYDFSQAHLTEQLAIHLSDVCVLLNEKSYFPFESVKIVSQFPACSGHSRITLMPGRTLPVTLSVTMPFI